MRGRRLPRLDVNSPQQPEVHMRNAVKNHRWLFLGSILIAVFGLAAEHRRSVRRASELPRAI
jgi:hypothetical protein